MISIGILVLGLVIAVILAIKPFKSGNGKDFILPSIVFVLSIIISLVQPYKMERVDSGNVGVRVNLTGNKRGVSDVTFAKGWVIYNTFSEQLFEFPVYQQHIEYDKQIVILKGGFQTVITPTFNYQLKEDAVVDMFRQLRLDIKSIETGWLKTAIISSVNDVSNRWKVDDIFNDREKFEMQIVADCNKRVGKWFIVTQLRTNILPPPSIQKSIEAKTRAVQLEQAKLTEVKVVEAEGKKTIAKARADSASAVIKASGKASAAIITAKAEAEAIKIKQKEVSKLYNDYIRATRWDGKYPTTVAGDGSGILLDAR